MGNIHINLLQNKGSFLTDSNIKVKYNRFK